MIFMVNMCDWYLTTEMKDIINGEGNFLKKVIKGLCQLNIIMFTKLTKQCYKTTNLHSFIIYLKVKVTQSCLTLCKPMDYTVHGILQVRILEWVAFLSSRGSFQPRDWTQVSCIAGRFFTSRATRDIYLIICKFTRRKFTCANSCIVLRLAVEILINMATFQWGNGKFHNFSNIQLVICDGGRIQTRFGIVKR